MDGGQDYEVALFLTAWNAISLDDRMILVKMASIMAERESLLNFVNKTLPEGVQLIKDGGDD